MPMNKIATVVQLSDFVRHTVPFAFCKDGEIDHGWSEFEDIFVMKSLLEDDDVKRKSLNSGHFSNGACNGYSASTLKLLNLLKPDRK